MSNRKIEKIWKIRLTLKHKKSKFQKEMISGVVCNEIIGAGNKNRISENSGIVRKMVFKKQKVNLRKD